MLRGSLYFITFANVMTLKMITHLPMKYPIGIQTFEKLRDSGYVYVDKTDLVYRLVTEGDVYFLSRPRRFGKSLLLSTIKAYFQGKKQLFEGLAMERLETEWNEFPVFHIDFNGKNFTNQDELQDSLNSFVTRVETEYDVSVPADNLGDRFIAVLKKATEQYGRKAVVLVDEYDKPLLDVMSTPIEAKNREILKGFYSTFKLADEYLQFVMLTGVTKFSQISVFSGFNQPNDISMDPTYETICGITEDELNSYFTEPMQEMAELMKMTLEDVRQEIKRMYDGYHFSRNMTDIYNPFSLLSALRNGIIEEFWFRTGTPTYLIKLMRHFDEDIDEIISKQYNASQFVDYRADEQRPLPMIYQSGYLTIKGYNARTNSFRLDFPNNEVKQGFVTMLANDYLKTKGDSASWIIEIVNALDIADLDRFHKLLAGFFASIPYSQRRRTTEPEQERDFQYTFYLLLRMISCYFVFVEKETSEGRADCVIEAQDYVYIFEFKRDGTAAEAIKQINDKGYANEYAGDKRKLFKIGCNFSTETGTVDDWLVE